MKTKLTLRASIRAYGRLREKGECCNLGAACGTYQDLRFPDADKNLPILVFKFAFYTIDFGKRSIPPFFHLRVQEKHIKV